MKKYLLLFLLVSFTSVDAAPVSYNFSHSGFDEGASVTGMFTGEDLDGNGKLSSFRGELIDFKMRFSGNNLVPAFSLGFADLVGIIYGLDSESLGDDSSGNNPEGIEVYLGRGSNVGVFSYAVAGPLNPQIGPVVECGTGVDCAVVSDGQGNVSYSQQLVLVSPKPVPLPATVWLFCSGLIGFLGIKRTQR